MNQQIASIYNIASKKEKIILGLMSGTSLDGLDLALCKFSESGFQTKHELINFETILYSNSFKDDIESVFCKEIISLEKLCWMNKYIATQHAQFINSYLQKHNIASNYVDVIASHGQTIYHSPFLKHKQVKYGNATLQIGDGDILSYLTNIITISDFRQKHIAAGGSGAPLALYADFFLWSSKQENRVLLNIGGIANFTYLPMSNFFDEIICTDTGPGNTLMNLYCKKFFKKNYDEDGLIAASATVDETFLNHLLSHAFFESNQEYSVGQEIFNESYVELAMQKNNYSLSNESVIATLNMFTAKSIEYKMNKFLPNSNYTIYVSGGGAKNKTLINNLQKLIPNISIKNSDAIGIDSNAKEAILMAFLANETLSNNYQNKNSTTNRPLISLGKISFPI